METAEATPTPAVRAPDLADLVTGPGPFLTVHLTIDQHLENQAHRNETRWRDARRSPEEGGVPGALLDPVDGLAPTAHEEGGGLFVPARADGTARGAHTADPPAGD